MAEKKKGSQEQVVNDETLSRGTAPAGRKYIYRYTGFDLKTKVKVVCVIQRNLWDCNSIITAHTIMTLLYILSSEEY